MRTHSLVFVLSALACRIALGESAAPLNDPWSGFPLGSWAIFAESMKQGEKVLTKRTRFEVVELSADGNVSLGETEALEDGKFPSRSSGMRMHILGGTPEQLGLDLVETSTARLSIDGEERECAVDTYRNPKDGSRADVLTRPYPEIMKEGPRIPEGVTIELQLWRFEGAQIPYHELRTPGLDVALGGDIVRAKWRMEQNGEIEESDLTITSRASVVTVGEVEIQCVAERESHKASMDGREELSAELTTWYSNAVPGRKVRQAGGGSQRGESVEIEMLVESFHVATSEAPAGAGKDALLPHPTWSSWRAGAWVATRGMHHDLPAGQQNTAGLKRVLGVAGDRLLVEKRWGEESTRSLEEIQEFLPGAAKATGEAREETLNVAGRELKCTVRDYEERRDTDYAGECVIRITLWTCDQVDLPVRDTSFGLLGAHVVRMERTATDEQSSSRHSLLLEDDDVEVRVAGRTVAAILETETRTMGSSREGKRDFREHVLRSAAVPGHEIARFEEERSGSRWVPSSESIIVAFGGPDEAIPGKLPAAPSLPALLRFE